MGHWWKDRLARELRRPLEPAFYGIIAPATPAAALPRVNRFGKVFSNRMRSLPVVARSSHATRMAAVKACLVVFSRFVNHG